MFVSPPKFIQKFFPSLICVQKNSDKIWLTFDDGPTPEVTPFILSVLKEENIKATFFLVGEQIEKYPALFQSIITDGHIVANHSYSHKNGWITCNKKYFNDIEKCQKLMPNNKLYRPPYGKISPLQILTLKQKYTLVLWDVLSWDFSQKITQRKVKENVIRNTKEGSIIVFHNNHTSYKNLGILKETLQELKKKGFEFSTSW